MALQLLNFHSNNKKIYHAVLNFVCIVPVPPPIHGASIMSTHLVESLSGLGKVKTISNSVSNENHEIGFFSMKKAFVILKTLVNIFRAINSEKSALVFWTPSENRLKFLMEWYAIKTASNGSKIIVYPHSWRLINSPYFHRFIEGKTNVYLIKLGDFHFDLSISSYIIRNFVSILPGKKHKTQVKKDKITIGYLSNFFIAKGILEFLQIASDIRRKCPNIEVMVAGQSGDINSDKIKSKCEILNFTFLGAIYGDKKSAFFEELDIFIFPTSYHNEYSPLVLLEALSADTVVYSTDTGIIKSTIGEEFTVETSEMADKIIKDISSKGIEELKMMARCKNIPSKLTYEFELKNVINEVCGF